MARFPRVVVADVPHHVTQRGNGRQVILGSDTDRLTYLALLREYAQLYGLALLGYCLMPNHVHLIAIPHSQAALSHALKQTHGRYAAYWNGRQSSSGHVWQGRFYSCPLDEKHLWQALRYVELNPVRAGIVEKAERWPWSSAAAHCGFASPDAILEMECWSKRWSAPEWRSFLAESDSRLEVAALRQFTHTGRPLGTPEFVSALEASMLRPLAARKRGRPNKAAPDPRQLSLKLQLVNPNNGVSPVCPPFSGIRDRACRVRQLPHAAMSVVAVKCWLPSARCRLPVLIDAFES